MSNKTAGGDKPTAESLLDSELEAAIVQEEIDARYMDRVDPNHPVLTVAEQIAALKSAELAVAAERKKQALASFEKKERERLSGKVGQLTGDPDKDEIVHVTIDLAEFTDRLVVNGVQYIHGQTYQVPRHVANSLREMCARTHAHQNELDGKGMAELHRRPQAPVLSGKKAA